MATRRALDEVIASHAAASPPTTNGASKTAREDPLAVFLGTLVSPSP
jgi:hypothetical protein